jgi:putative transposase
MVGPARKREAVAHVQRRLDASERRACRSLGQPRSTQRYRCQRTQIDAGLVRAMRRIAGHEPRAGYRTVARYLRWEGWQVNDKRVHRLWKREGLKVPLRTRKRRRMGESAQGARRRKAERINHVWSYDFLHDHTENGNRLKWLPILDEFTRECLSLEVEHSITADDVIATLERLIEQRGPPEFIRSDNGPEFVAQKLKEWIKCRGFQTIFIEPGAPWQNPYSESFNSRLRDEFLNVESFSSLLEAKVLGKERFHKYNHLRPHSSLGDQTPAEFATRCLAPLRPTACASQDSEPNNKHKPNLS